MSYNLKTLNEGKINIGVAIYLSDKEKFEKIADERGVTTSLLLRSLINDVIDGKITF